MFLVSFSIILIGTFLKIMNWGFTEPTIIIGLLCTLSYIILGIFEVNNSPKIDKPEKYMWAIAFIFFGFITGLVYLISGRKRIMQ